MSFGSFRQERNESDPETDQLTELLIGVFIEVHKELGPGLTENFYEEAVCHELEKQLGPDFRDDCGIVSELFSLLPLRDGAPDPTEQPGPEKPDLPDLPALPGVDGLLPEALVGWGR